MKLFLFILAGLLTTSSIKADGIDRNAALKKAQMFMPDRQFTDGKSVLSARSRGKNACETSAFYVFNAENNKGFVVVSGDDCTRDILGYSEQGNIDMEHLPDNLRWWLDSYASQIAAMSSASVAASPTPIGPAIEPIIKSKWNQDWPYNSMCPDGNFVDYDESGYDTNNRCVSGCVPTAVSQVMYYWQWPKSCAALDSYEVIEGKMLKGLPATTFKWSDMTDTYYAWTSNEAALAVGELMRYCGQALHIRYGPGVTSGYADPSVLVKTFGYSKKIRQLMRDDYTTSQWETVVYNELAAKRPLLYSGASDMGGHQFIVDGYDGNGFFHINWGWSGLPDSYFVLSVADPGTDQGIGGSVGAYYFGQKALFNMQPAEDGELMLPVMRVIGSHMYPPEVNNVYTRTDATADFTNVFLGSQITTDYPIEPESEMTAEVGWAFYQNDEFVLLAGSNTATIPAKTYGDVFNSMTVDFGAGLKEGSYLISQVFRFSGDTDWQRCEGYGINSLHAEVTPTTLTVRAPDNNNMSYKVNSLNMSDYPEAGSPSTLFANITNTGETQQITARLWIQKQGETDWTQCSKTTCYTDLGTDADISLTFLQEDAGTYNLKLTTNNFEEAIETTTVSFAAYQEVVVDGLRYRCVPEYKRARVVRDFEADTSLESPNIRQTITSDGVDCRVVEIGNSAFYGWGITSLDIPEGIETIGADAFRHCINLTKIVLPSTLTSIGAYAFYGIPKLSSVVSHLQDPPVIGKELFMYQLGDMYNNSIYYYQTEATLYVPLGSKSKYEALSGWTVFNVIDEGDLAETVVDGIRYSYATEGTTATVVKDDSYQNMTEATIPATVVIEGKARKVIAIGLSAFGNCSNLKKITLSEGLETIGERALANSELEEIIMPSSLKTIGEQAFMGCHYIKNMTVVEGVTTIRDKAFYYMGNLDQLELPKSLTSVGSELIRGCDNLKTVVCHVTNPYPINSRTFIGQINLEGDAWILIPSNATLYVPKGELAAYQALTGWNYFADIKEIDSDTGIERITNIDDNHLIHYDLTGRVINPEVKGLHIVKIGNNRSVKVMY